MAIKGTGCDAERCILLVLETGVLCLHPASLWVTWHQLKLVPNCLRGSFSCHPSWVASLDWDFPTLFAYWWWFSHTCSSTETEKKFMSQADNSLRTRWRLCQDFWDDVEGQAVMHLKYHIAFWMFYIFRKKWCWKNLGFPSHCLLLLMQDTITGSNYSLCHQTGLT